MRLDVTRIKIRWRELARSYPVDEYTRNVLRHQIDPDTTPEIRHHCYGGSNGEHDAVVDAIAEELTQTINEALSALDSEKLERLLDLLITSRMTGAK